MPPLVLLALLCASSGLVDGLKSLQPDPPPAKQQEPYHQPVKFRQLHVGQLVPHTMVDNHHILQGFDMPRDVTSAQCEKHCRSEPTCAGWQHGYRHSRPGYGNWITAPFCNLRGAKVHLNGTCAFKLAAAYRDRGFRETPMVPLTKSDGTVKMREDCMEKHVHKVRNTYWDLPWSWTQKGTSLVNRSGYGTSPLMPLVTDEVLKDVLWSAPWGREDSDLYCRDYNDSTKIMHLLKRTRLAHSPGHAIVADIGPCICAMFGAGWDPRTDLRTDTIFVLFKDINFSPASPYTDIAVVTLQVTQHRCVREGLDKSVFPDDITAFTALANHEKTRALYFRQTPPITHDKLFIIPLGVEHNYLEVVWRNLGPQSTARTRSREALYEVSHNMAIKYRKEVFLEVEKNFAAEHTPLHYRHLPWADGTRLDEIFEETAESVFGQSPIGIGENCFRHTELLLAGVIPVVQGSLGVASMRYLPHVSVARWSDVTPALLRSEYTKLWEQIRNGEFSLAPLTNSFWQEHRMLMANGTGLDSFYAKFPNPNVTCPTWKCL